MKELLSVSLFVIGGIVPLFAQTSSENATGQPSRVETAATGVDESVQPELIPRSPENLSLEELVSELKTEKADKKRIACFKALSAYTPKTEKDAELLVTLMRGEDEETAAHARIAIAGIKEKSFGLKLHGALKELKPALRHISDAEFKALEPKLQNKRMVEALNVVAIVAAIGGAGYKEAAPDLRDLLDYDKEYEGQVSMTASLALGQLGDEASFNRIMGDLPSKENISAAGYGPRGIRKIVEKIDELNASFKTKPREHGDKRPSQISNLGMRLGRMGNRDPEAKEALRRLLGHGSVYVQNGAATALVWSLNADDKDITLEMLKHKYAGVRLSGVHSLHLAKTWDKSLLPVLMDMMQNDPNSGVRGAVIDELATLASLGVRRDDLKETIPYLEAGLKDSDMCDISFIALRRVTGRYYTYEKMSEILKKRKAQEPEFLPENKARVFK